MINSNGVVSPTSPAGSTVRHLPEDVQRAWQEVRSAHAVAAYTAAELMCRKILMHLAVDVAEADAGKSFQHYVGVLVDEGYVPKPLEQTIDKVRQRGNTATHELPASTEEESLATLTITEHMLRGIYEIPSI